MRKPTPLEAFDALYGLAAGDGRGEALFGESYPLARRAYGRTLIGSACPDAGDPVRGRPPQGPR
ncbi:MAG: hypothetical protein IJI16_05660 [Atopobiaceae bacterium]|nr:hypothetical protein [Atopobiaceae bacterium]